MLLLMLLSFLDRSLLLPASPRVNVGVANVSENDGGAPKGIKLDRRPVVRFPAAGLITLLLKFEGKPALKASMETSRDELRPAVDP